MRLAIVSAVASALIGFACAAIPLSDAVAQAPKAAAPAAVNGQLDLPLVKDFLSKATPLTKAQEASSAADGLAAAPAMIQAAGITCTPTEARMAGVVTGKVNYKAIETTCKDGLGYILLQKDSEKPTAADCLAVAVEFTGKSPLLCSLPANANAAGAMTGMLKRAKSDCVPTNASFVGGSATALGYEVACQGGSGVVLQVVLPRTDTSAIQANSCYGYAQTLNKEGADFPCKLTTKDANTAAVASLAAKGSAPCTPTKQRFVNGLTDGSEYFEFACQGGKGEVVQATNGGNVLRTIPCAQAGAMCTLTTVDLAAANGELTTRIKAAGTTCDVTKFQALKLAAGVSEALEVTCKAGPGGVLVTKADKTMFFDCGRSLPEGYSCALNGKDAANVAMTAQLKAQGKSTCVVNGTKAMASASFAYVETTCSDGAPGYVLRFPRDSNSPIEEDGVLTCLRAKEIGVPCSLPTNKAS